MKRYMKMAEAMTMEPSKRPSDFIDALVKMQKACKVDDLKLSDWALRKRIFLKWLRMQRKPWEACSCLTRAC